ncbi:hypothetical protein [Brevundimonas sp.]|uniref:hypothetical protein n=1 Tax=Brevundimonas sp. TaxID=1871086 RepID=UPI00286B6D15|nr:hypothetical protein [Brevundimonas sp.]
MTPNRLVALLRICALCSAVCLTILFLGPFTYLVDVFHVTDKEAHALAFFGVTLGLFAIAPRWRRTDLALAALAFGVLIELAQGLTGRGVSLTDLMADGVGILAALVPGIVERLRHHLRTSPDIDFASIRARDRRSRTAPVPASLIQPETPAAVRAR